MVSITEIIEYYKKGYMSATVGTRWHLMSSDDLSSLSNLASATCESECKWVTGQLLFKIFLAVGYWEYG